MSSLRYKILLRMIYGAVLNSRLSTSDLKALSDELRRGRFSDELAYMISRSLEHLGGSSDSELEDERIAEAERLIRQGKISKTALSSMMGSLGLPPLSFKESVREMLERFLTEASPSRQKKLMELLSTSQSDDKFLAGISESRK